MRSPSTRANAPGPVDLTGRGRPPSRSTVALRLLATLAYLIAALSCFLNTVALLVADGPVLPFLAYGLGTILGLNAAGETAKRATAALVHRREQATRFRALDAETVALFARHARRQARRDAERARFEAVQKDLAGLALARLEMFDRSDFPSPP